MRRENRMRIMELVWPILAVPYLTLKGLDKVLVAWWLEPWLQRRKNQSLWHDVKTTLCFLYEKGMPIDEKHTSVLPFDYASVHLAYDNMQVCFTRGRGELNVSLSPRNDPTDGFELPLVLAVLDSRDVTEIAQSSDLAGVADLLRTRLKELNHVFSQNEYPEFKRKLLEVKNNMRIRTREVEWELNKRLYH